MSSNQTQARPARRSPPARRTGTRAGPGPGRFGALLLLLLWFLPSWRAGLHHSLVEHRHGADGRCWHLEQEPRPAWPGGEQERVEACGHGHGRAVAASREAEPARKAPAGRAPAGSGTAADRGVPEGAPRWRPADGTLIAGGCTIPWPGLPGSGPELLAAPGAGCPGEPGAIAARPPRAPERRGEALFRLAPKGSPPASGAQPSFPSAIPGTRPRRA